MKTTAIMLTFLAVIAFSGMAYAQQTTGDPQQVPATPSTPTTPGAQGDMATEGQPMTVPRASEIIGLEVTGQDNEKLGEVSDLILGDDGSVDYLVVSEGGVVGIGEKHVAIPWDAAQAQFNENAVTVAFGKDEFDKAPTFGSWNEFESGDYEQSARGYFGEESKHKSGTSGTMGTESKTPESGAGSGAGTGSQQQ